jgi:hypothetical protein
MNAPYGCASANTIEADSTGHATVNLPRRRLVVSTDEPQLAALFPQLAGQLPS